MHTLFCMALYHTFLLRQIKPTFDFMMGVLFKFSKETCFSNLPIMYHYVIGVFIGCIPVYPNRTTVIIIHFMINSAMKKPRWQLGLNLECTIHQTPTYFINLVAMNTA